MSVKYNPLSTLPGYTYTRSGAKSELGANGVPVAFAANEPGVVPGVGYWSRAAATNALLNAGAAASLATQSVTVTAVAHTLSFIGTGSVALSGAHTATLTGTGANNRVVLVFTPTAAALTLTVTGSVTYAGLIAADLPDGGPIIPTTTAAATVGADNLEVAATLPDGDFIIWAVVNLSGIPAANVAPFTYSTAGFGAVGERLFPFINSAGTWAIASGISVGGVGQPFPPAILTVIGSGGGRAAVMVRRKYGIYSLAAKKTGGAVVIGADAAGSGLVPAITAVDVGSLHNGGLQLNGRVEALFQRNGTFTDEQTTAILQGA